MRNDALSVVSKLAASPNNVFTRSQAALEGLGHRDIARLKVAGLLAEPWRGTLVAFPADNGPTWQQMVAAATTGREAVATARASARLQRIDGFDRSPELDVVCDPSVNVRLAGVNVRRSSTLVANDVIEVDGIRCTNLARMLCDLGNEVAPLLLERAFDDVVRRGAHPRWIRETAERALAPRLEGPARVLQLLAAHEQRGTVRGSWFEKLVELCLVHPELQDMTQQHTLRDDDGDHVATFDLAVPDAKLAVEAHSREHHYGSRRECSDERRDNRAAALGWEIMYFGYADTRSPTSVRDLVVRTARVRREQFGHGPMEHGTSPT